jgi:hypothetical protein
LNAKSSHKYGEVKSASLTVCGYVRQARWTGHQFTNVISDDSCGSSSILPITAVWDSSVEAPQGFYLCLEINLMGSKSCGIILTSVDGQSFKRVGYFEYCDGLWEPKMSSKFAWLHNDGARTITIV